MSIFAPFILLCHYTLVLILCVYGAHRSYYAFSSQRRETANKKINHAESSLQENSQLSTDSLPVVTVQAPIFNEQFVVERLIHALAALEYPADRLQIQIVDDSNDETVEIASRCIAFHRARGINIEHVRRPSRGGYKAGALEAALETSVGEYIAVFDADFIPEPQFLLHTIPAFKDPEVGMVQTRWHHLNANSNVLTRVQAILLDAHFAIEQYMRAETGAYFNFNGTAGVWRRETIIDAGGWRADTLTEDLDLSYRAQMKGWRFEYLHNVGCPSELPVDMGAFKSQQHRWAKGAIEVMKKMLLSIWKSSAPLHVKTEATFHLTGNITYLLMLIDSLFFLIPSIHIRETANWGSLMWIDIPLFLLASVSHAYFFLSGQKILYGRLRDKLAILPVLLATSIGLGVNNGRAVIEAIVGHATGFVRTPKTGDMTGSAITTSNRVEAVGSDNQTIPVKGYKVVSAQWAYRLEILLALAYFGDVLWAGSRGYFIVVPFLMLFAFGFMFTGVLSMKAHHAKASN